MADLYLKHIRTHFLYKSGTDLASEALLYYYKKDELLKIFTKRSTLANKQYIVEKLLEHKDDITIPELVLPEGRVFYKGNFMGYRMPLYEDSVNIAQILFDPATSLAFKLQILKEVITIILAVEDIEKLKGQFFLGDIYGNNFIWDIRARKVRAVDVDGCYILGSKGQKAFHLPKNSDLRTVSKYPFDEEMQAFAFNHETSIACFIFMLLNTLANTYKQAWSKEDLDSYLNYLDACGFNQELLDYCARIYGSDITNIFEPDFLEKIDTRKDYRLIRK